MPSRLHRPHRSCLYMPASNGRALEKAKSIPADVLIFDLEDAVAPSAKEEARRAAIAATADRDYGNRELVIRINGLDSDWGWTDLREVSRSRADAVLVPKIKSAEDIRILERAMTDFKASASCRLWVMAETPEFFARIVEVGAASGGRLQAFVLGFNDLAKDMHMALDDSRTGFAPLMLQAAIVARANNLLMFDSVYNDFSDEAGLQAECGQARRLGYDGKTLIHPAQIDTANRAFAPTGEDIATAKTIIAAFEQPENAGKGAIQIDGKMVELLHLEQARRTLTLAKAIESTSY